MTVILKESLISDSLAHGPQASAEATMLNPSTSTWLHRQNVDVHDEDGKATRRYEDAYLQESEPRSVPGDFKVMLGWRTEITAVQWYL